MHHQWSRYAQRFRDDPQDISEPLTIIPAPFASASTKGTTGPRWAAMAGTDERGRQLRRPYIFSETQVLLPHSHSNIWNVRPVGGSGMLETKRGCLPHFEQHGEVSVGRSCFSIRRFKFRGSTSGARGLLSCIGGDSSICELSSAAFSIRTAAS